MSLLDKFRKPKETEKKKTAKQSENVLDLVKEGATAPEKDKPAKKAVALKGDTGNAFMVLMRPQLSEKANMLAAGGKYVFRVNPQSNKPEIRKAVEKVYDVHVREVNIIVMSGKSRRYGRSSGKTKSWKKAIVTVAPGERIEGITETV